MAGDWIKMRTDLSEDPSVISMAFALQLDEDTIVGKLHRLWSWADKQTSDGNVPRVSFLWIDRKVGVTGFAKAMADAGWLEEKTGGIVIPKFEKHNGESAKKRALTARRVVKFRGKPCNATVTPVALTREEKRREEKNKPPKAPKGAAVEEIPIPENLKTPEFSEAWDAWKRHRDERRRKLTPESVRQQLKELSEWGPARAVAAIMHSIAKGWQGIFEPKSTGPPRQGPLSGLKAYADKHGVTDDA